MAQRIVRAKNKIRTARIPYRVPPRRRPARPAARRARGACTWSSPKGTRDVGRRVGPQRPRRRGDPAGPPAGRADARRARGARPARADAAHRGPPAGADVARRHAGAARRPGPERAGTDDLVDEGLDLVRRCLRRDRPGPYQVQAAINAVHASAPDTARPTGARSSPCYDQLLALTPTPMVALNRAVAVAEIEGPGAALVIVDGLRSDSATTTCSTPSARTSCAGSAATTRPTPPTPTRPTGRATRSSATSSTVVAVSSEPRVGQCPAHGW